MDSDSLVFVLSRDLVDEGLSGSGFALALALVPDSRIHALQSVLNFFELVHVFDVALVVVGSLLLDFLE